jgi:large subunit ribosomal protein L22
MEKINRAIGRDLPISTKQSIEICSYIRGRSVKKSKYILQKVIEKEMAIPFKRFNKDMGHRPGRMAAGRYPIKSCQNILKILNSAESNAVSNGSNVDNLFIKNAIANKASQPLHTGRKIRRKMKRAHIEIILEEKNDRKEVHKPKN